MRYITTSSGLRSSVSAVAVVAVVGLIAFLFESPYTRWDTHTQPSTEQAALSAPASDRDVRDV